MSRVPWGALENGNSGPVLEGGTTFKKTDCLGGSCSVRIQPIQRHRPIQPLDDRNHVDQQQRKGHLRVECHESDVTI